VSCKDDTLLTADEAKRNLRQQAECLQKSRNDDTIFDSKSVIAARLSQVFTALPPIKRSAKSSAPESESCKDDTLLTVDEAKRNRRWKRNTCQNRAAMTQHFNSRKCHRCAILSSTLL
jgi:hypothetical protein